MFFLTVCVFIFYVTYLMFSPFHFSLFVSNCRDNINFDDLLTLFSAGTGSGERDGLVQRHSPES